MPTQLCHSQIHPGHRDKLIPSHIPLALPFPDFLWVEHVYICMISFIIWGSYQDNCQRERQNDRLVSSTFFLAPFSILTSSGVERFSSLCPMKHCPAQWNPLHILLPLPLTDRLVWPCTHQWITSIELESTLWPGVFQAHPSAFGNLLASQL